MNLCILKENLLQKLIGCHPVSLNNVVLLMGNPRIRELCILQGCTFLLTFSNPWKPKESVLIAAKGCLCVIDELACESEGK